MARASLPESLASPDAKGRYVRRLFATIADRYDLITRVLSYGRDAAWKRRLVSMSGARAGLDALDLACGTGDIAFSLAARGARVSGLDLTHRMLQLARAKMPPRPRVAFLAGDMMELPFGDARFDLVTAGYGLRNVPRLEPAIHEIQRVLRPGGLLLSLDFNRPSNALMRGIYLGYLTIAGSTLGWILHRDPDTAGVSALLERSGFADCRVVPLLGGLMAINVARRR
jgi:demethylmenaquinone methyltransferase/2-methoxy-6-polyprenyl-1,4-benzoquinol methylase